MKQSTAYCTFADDEVTAIVEAAPSKWWRAFIVVSLDTGIRIQEALRLHVTDVDVRTQSIRITSEPTDETDDPDVLSLRTTMPIQRERVLPISMNSLACLGALRAERITDRHVFVPDWKVDQLWTRITQGDPVTSEMLCPGIHHYFQLIQRRAKYQHAIASGALLTDLFWPRRGLPSLRSTAIARLAQRMSERELAECLGQASTRSIRHLRNRPNSTEEVAA